jgi:hypothetical protein
MKTKKWEELISESDDAYFFHSPFWAKIMEKTYDFRDSTKFFEVSGREILVPMMKRKKYGFNFLHSMPFGYGGFFSESTINSNDIKKLVNKIIGERDLIFNFIMPPFSNLSFDFEKPLITEIKDSWNYTHILPANGDYEHFWGSRYNRKTRRAIKKAVKNKVGIRKGDSLDDFKEYYYLYSKNSERWGYETPPDPYDLYKNMYKYGSDHVDLNLAIKDNETIGGVIALNYGKNIYLWGSAFLAEFGALNPVSLLFNDIIKNAYDNGYEYVDFGESGDLSGVKKFKESFGAENIRLNRFKVCSKIGRLALNVYERTSSISAINI